MTHRRRFTAEFKIQVVLELISGAKSAAEICRQHQVSPQVLARWKAEFLERAPRIFAHEEEQQAEHTRIAELERLVGRLTMELDIAKKASAILSSASSRNGRS
jgi:transposase